MISKNDIAVVCGNYINAHTIVRSLIMVGFPGRVVVMRDQGEPVRIADRFNPGVERWAPSIKSAEDLPKQIQERFGRKTRIFVFFTDERFHLAFAQARLEELSNLEFHFGAIEHVMTILDRFEFCRFIEDRHLADVPMTIPGEEDPFSVFGESFVMRPRLSWNGIDRHEEVRLVHGRREWERFIADYASRGLTAQHLCYQEMLSIRNEDNMSICGWYGPGRKLLLCTRKVLQHPLSTGDGDVIERIESPAGVMEAAKTVLGVLRYDGPFELEFVLDERSGRYNVIEMNPRFWLQHGLVEAVLGYALTSSYLGLSPLSVDENARPCYWVNPMYAFFRLMKGDTRGWKHLMADDAWTPMSVTQVALYAPFHVADKILRSLRGKRATYVAER